MKIIDDILDALSNIEVELSRINDTCEEDELKDWYKENLERAYELIQDAHDLIW